MMFGGGGTCSWHMDMHNYIVFSFKIYKISSRGEVTLKGILLIPKLSSFSNPKHRDKAHHDLNQVGMRWPTTKRIDPTMFWSQCVYNVSESGPPRGASWYQIMYLLAYKSVKESLFHLTFTTLSTTTRLVAFGKRNMKIGIYILSKVGSFGTTTLWHDMTCSLAYATTCEPFV